MMLRIFSSTLGGESASRPVSSTPPIQGPRAESREDSHGRVSERHARLVVISSDVIFAETATVQALSMLPHSGQTLAEQGATGERSYPGS